MEIIEHNKELNHTGIYSGSTDVLSVYVHFERETFININRRVQEIDYNDQIY